MVRSGKLEGLDNTLFVIVGASFGIPFLISVYGLDIRLIAIPSMLYGGWILFVGYFKPKVLSDGNPNLAQVERMRGWVYVLGLPVLLILNFVFIFVLSKDLINFLLSIITVPLILIAIVLAIQKSIFGIEIAKMDKAQVRLLKNMMTLAGGSVILTSVALLLLTEMVTSTSSLSLFGGYFIGSVVLLFLGYYRYRQSSKCAKELATSLKWKKNLKKKPIPKWIF